MTTPGPPTEAARVTGPSGEAAEGALILPKIKLGMESISDIVFGLALSIGSIILISHVPQDPTELGVDLLAFGFNFLIIIMVWLGYRRSVVTLPQRRKARCS